MIHRFTYGKAMPKICFESRVFMRCQRQDSEEGNPHFWRSHMKEFIVLVGLQTISL